MRRTLLKSKIHRATVTGADLNYQGSISIDKSLCDKADMIEYEKVYIYNITNGERFSTYVIYGEKGQIGLNGAAARKVHTGDLIIIASYAEYNEEECANFKTKLIFVDEHNNEMENGK